MRKIFIVTVFSVIWFLHLSGQTPKVNFENDIFTLSYVLDDTAKAKNDVSSQKINLNLPGFSIIDEAGKPALPFKNITFTLPAGKVPGSLNISVKTDTICGVCPAAIPPYFPNQLSALDNQNEINPYKGEWPLEWATYNSFGKYRDVEIGSICISPIKYNYVSKRFVVAKELRVSFKLQKSPVALNSKIRHFISPEELVGLADYNLCNDEENGINLEKASDFRYKTNYSYLIISNEDFKDNVEIFASWKRRLGYNVYVKYVSSTKATSPETTIAMIKDIYEKDPLLSYVLLIANGKIIVPSQGKYSDLDRLGIYDYYTDYYFACMDDEDGVNDNKADLSIGRIPATYKFEAATVINKIMAYEQNILSRNYYQNALLLGDFNTNPKNNDKDSVEVGRAIRTLEEIHDYMESDIHNITRAYFAKDKDYPKYWDSNYGKPGEIPYYLQRPYFAWNADGKKVSQEIEKGQSYVLYIGHGLLKQWGKLGFTDILASKLKNGVNLPVFFGMTCYSGMFYHPIHKPRSQSSLAEKALFNSDGGCVAFIGANQQSFTPYNEYMVHGIFEAIQPYPGLFTNPLEQTIYLKPVRKLGSLLQAAERHLYKAINYGSFEEGTNYRRYNREVYHCLGDPSIKLKLEMEKSRALTKTTVNGVSLYNDTRDLVMVNKETKEVAIVNTPDHNYDLEELSEDYWLSFIGDGYIPLLINEELERSQRSIQINEISESGNILSVKLSSDSPANAAFYDIFGTKVAEAVGENGEIVLTVPSNSIGSVVITKSGEYQDSKMYKTK